MTEPGKTLRVLILGATSGIAEATGRIYAREGARLVLAARQPQRLEDIAADLRTRGAAQVELAVVDFAAETDYRARLVEFAERLGGLDHILLAYGVLGDQEAARSDWPQAASIIDVNFRSAAGWTLAAANHLEHQGNGSLVVLGSVAGDRGRRANFIYGAAKAAIATLVEGVAHRFAGKGPHVVVVKPGPTDTPMTAGMRKGGLWSSPERVAAIVRRAADGGAPVVYAPWFWRYIMLVIRLLPASIFNKLNI
jgi:decaprenylphospho-beta-D-erythro-pentofuranosid-2-ulose 2-reductase